MSDTKHMLTAVKVWAAAAWADGVIVEAEAMTMKAIISMAKLSDEERTIARGFIEKKVTLEDVDVAKIPPAERTHIYAVACGVAAMDKDIAAAERGFLDRLAKTLAISEEDAKKARSGAGL